MIACDAPARLDPHGDGEVYGECGARRGEGAEETDEEGPMAVKKDPFTKATERFHRELLRKVLEESDWNIVESARLLGIRRSKPKPRGGPPKAAAMRTRRG